MSRITIRVERIPWVTRLKKPGECSGWKSGTPLKAIYVMHGNPPVGLGKYRCKNRGWWKFRALKKSYAQDGIYCWNHLIHRCLHGDFMEQARVERWFARHPEAM